MKNIDFIKNIYDLTKQENFSDAKNLLEIIKNKFEINNEEISFSIVSKLIKGDLDSYSEQKPKLAIVGTIDNRQVIVNINEDGIDSVTCPTIIKSERDRMSDDGFAKNIRAMVDIIGSFDVSNVYDPFAGSGTTGFASIELGIECTLVEIDALKFSELKKKFNFFL